MDQQRVHEETRKAHTAPLAAIVSGLIHSRVVLRWRFSELLRPLVQARYSLLSGRGCLFYPHFCWPPGLCSFMAMEDRAGGAGTKEQYRPRLSGLARSNIEGPGVSHIPQVEENPTLLHSVRLFSPGPRRRSTKENRNSGCPANCK